MKSTVPRPCHIWATRLAAAHPDDLTPADRAGLEAHLASCPTCAVLAARYAQMDARILHSPAPDPLPALPAKLLALWAEEDQAVVSETHSASIPALTRTPRSGSAPVLPSSPVVLRERQRGTSHRLVSLVSALAAIVVVALLTTALVVSRLLPGPSTGNPQSKPTTTQPTVQPTTIPTVTATAGNYPVEVYFARHPDSDADPTAVFPVQRISPTLGVATFALTQLFAGPTASEKAQGYYSPFDGALGETNYCSDPSKDFTLSLDHRGSTPEQGTVTVQLCRTVSIAGELDGARMKAMITSTLLQFPGNKQVVILNYAGQCFDDLRGDNQCLTGP
jgi:anti-sigma factor RsiW